MKHKNLILGDNIFDNTNQEVVEITPNNINRYELGIIHYKKAEKEFIFGFFQKDPTQQIVVRTRGRRSPTPSSYLAINKEIFDDQVIYDNSYGTYKIKKPGDDPKTLIDLKGQGRFPYTIQRLYEAEDHLEEFAKSKRVQNIFREQDTKLLKYTFGLEYETTSGYIPQELCYRYGLIPVRDGSISGIEYASIVLDNKDGVERIKKHLELLKEYTSHNKDCSYHIHMGGYPVDSKAVFTLYTIWGAITEQLERYLPKYSFQTDKFKSSGKNYCKKNPTDFLTFQELYTHLSSGATTYGGSMTKNHPMDPEKRAKWNIRERYWAQSLIGMCFYKKPKTVEYRLLTPTYNFNKLVFWLYMFNAIMLYSEAITEKYRNLTPESIVFHILKENPTIEKIIKTVYPQRFADKMLAVLEQIQSAITMQTISGDFIGANGKIEEKIIKENILE